MNLRNFIIGLFLTLLTIPALADKQTFTGSGSSTPFDGGTVGSGINAPFFNGTGEDPFRFMGNPFLLPYGTGNVTWGSDTCTDHCSLLLGTGSGTNLPSNDYLSFCMGWFSCHLANITRPELFFAGWRSGANGSGATFNFIAGMGINVLGSCTSDGTGTPASQCNNDSLFGIDSARDATYLVNSVMLGNGAGVNGTLNQSICTGIAACNWPVGGSGNINSNIYAYGYRACFGNAVTTANGIICVGNSAGSNITTAAKDIFIGDSAGQAATTMQQTILMGWKAGTLATTTQNSTIVGVLSASNGNPGNNNSIFGFNNSTTLNSSATNNVFVGDNNFAAVTSGSFNIGIGSTVGGTCTICTNNVIIGSDVVTAASNRYTSMGGVRGYNIVPTLFSGAGTGATIAGNSFIMKVVIGTTPSSVLTLTMSQAPTAWACDANDETTHSSTTHRVVQTANTTTSVSMTFLNSVDVATAPAANDNVYIKCLAM